LHQNASAALNPAAEFWSKWFIVHKRFPFHL